MSVQKKVDFSRSNKNYDTMQSKDAIPPTSCRILGLGKMLENLLLVGSKRQQ